MRTIVQLIVVFALGGGLMFYSLQGLNSGEVSCGGQKMSRGEICTTTSNGTTTRRNYDDQRSQGRQGYYIGIGLGGLVLLGGGALVLAGARNRRQERTARKQISQAQQLVPDPPQT